MNVRCDTRLICIHLHSLLDALGGTGVILGVQVSQEQGVDECRFPKTRFT